MNEYVQVATLIMRPEGDIKPGRWFQPKPELCLDSQNCYASVNKAMTRPDHNEQDGSHPASFLFESTPPSLFNFLQGALSNE
jgi:hypothetical protein